MKELTARMRKVAKQLGMTKKRNKRKGQTWFDDECKRKRKKVWKALTIFRKTKRGVDRETLIKEKTELEQLSKKKRKCW